MHFNEFMINFHDYRHKEKNDNSITNFVKILKQNYSKSLSTKKLNLEEFNQHKYEQREHRQQRAPECTHQ